VPARERAAQHCEECTVGGLELGSLDLAEQHLDLVLEDRDLDVLGVLALEPPEQDARSRRAAVAGRGGSRSGGSTQAHSRQHCRGTAGHRRATASVNAGQLGLEISERESAISSGQTSCADLRGRRPIGIGINLPSLMTVSSPLWLCSILNDPHQTAHCISRPRRLPAPDRFFRYHDPLHVLWGLDPVMANSRGPPGRLFARSCGHMQILFARMLT
jgi:hypothetical protein